MKGFNYLSAIDDSDLQTYLVDQFDYTFFPCAQNIEINIISDCIEKISVYGSPDWKTMYEKIGNKFTVSKIKSAFPSDLQRKKNGDVETRGGLILVKI